MKLSAAVPQVPVTHVIDGGRGGRSGRRCAARLDDGGAALLHGGDEGVFVPLAIDEAMRGLAVDGAEIEIRILRRGMIAPDQHLADLGHVAAGFLGELRNRAVVIEARHRGEIARVQVLRVGARDHGVGVGRIADHQHADIAVRHLVHRLALRGEDLRVGHEQVLALHAGTARPRADQQRGVAVLERHASHRRWRRSC